METHPVSSNRPAIVAGGLLVVIGLLSLASNFITGLGIFVWAGMLVVVGGVIAVYYLTDRSQPWVLIPAYVMFAIAGLLALIGMDWIYGTLIPSYVLSAIGLPFLYGFFRDMKNWGLLIPAYVMFVLAAMIYLIGEGFLTDLLIPAYINFAIALPFLLVFMINPRNWWALIPGGIMTAVAAGFLMGTDLMKFGVPAVLIMIGIVVLFGPLVRRTSTPPAAVVTSEPAPLEVEKTYDR